MRENTKIYQEYLQRGILREHHGSNWSNDVKNLPITKLLDAIKQYSDLPANARLYRDLEKFIEDYLIAK